MTEKVVGWGIAMLINLPNDHSRFVNKDTLATKPLNHITRQSTHQDFSPQESFTPLENSKALADSITYWASDLLNSPAQEQRLLTPLHQSHPLTELRVLQKAADLGAQQKGRGHSICKGTTPSERVGNYAEPISPLRERDIVALAELFHREDIHTIEVDISQMLLHLLPEPCWEEDPFEFLRDFL